MIKKVQALIRGWLYQREKKSFDEKYRTVFKNAGSGIAVQPNRISGKSVAFVVRTINRFAGGITSVLRLGTYLSEHGYEVSYVVCNKGSLDKLRENAQGNLPGFKGSVLALENEDLNSYDCLIATHWITAYQIKNFSPYKMHFVQDYEPFFYQYSEIYHLASEAYRFGFHIVSLGAWNASRIKAYNQVDKIDAVSFPYEPKEYVGTKARSYQSYLDSKEINVCVYIKVIKKRCPDMLQMLLSELKTRFKNEGVNFNISYYGATIRFFPSEIVPLNPYYDYK